MNPADGFQPTEKYINKISGPLLDRFDIFVEVNSISCEELSNKSSGESSKEIRKRVEKVRDEEKALDLETASLSEILHAKPRRTKT